jgi:2-hydroxy-6-oxonona-2,4-dienedioate hydrolase
MVEPLLGALARHGFHVLAPDLPGFGESTKPPRALKLTELADALALWAQASGIARALYIGASFGCHVIVELALRHPSLVDQLVLLGPGPEPAARSLPPALWRQAVNSQREPRSLGEISRIDYAKAGLRHALATIRIALHARIEDKLPLVRMPTLVLRGDRDLIAPQAWAEHATSLLPRGRLMVVDGAHVLSYGAPEAAAAAILDFLRENPLSPHAGVGT